MNLPCARLGDLSTGAIAFFSQHAASLSCWLPASSPEEITYPTQPSVAEHSAQHAAFYSADAAHTAASAAFRAFATEHCHTQLLAAELVADSAVRGKPPAEWAAEYPASPWPDIVVLPDGIGEAEEQRARAQCRADCRAGRELLLRALRACVR